MRADDPRHGTYAGARAGCDCAPCSKAHYLYNVRLTQDHDRGVWRTVSARGFSRRTRALQALGWPLAELEPRLGMPLSNIHRAAAMKDQIHLTTHQRMVDVFEDLCMTPGPSSRMRLIAKNKGYLPPLAWDDIDLDDEPCLESCGDAIDEVAIEKALDGWNVALTRPEREVVVARQLERGGSLNDLGRTLGINPHRYLGKAA